MTSATLLCCPIHSHTELQTVFAQEHGRNVHVCAECGDSVHYVYPERVAELLAQQAHVLPCPNRAPADLSSDPRLHSEQMRNIAPQPSEPTQKEARALEKMPRASR